VNIATSSQIHFKLKACNVRYKLILEGCSPENISANEFQITFNTSNRIKKQIKKTEEV